MAIVHVINAGQFGVKLGAINVATQHLEFSLNPANNNIIAWYGYEFTPNQLTPGPIDPTNDPCGVFTLDVEQFRAGNKPQLTIDYNTATKLIGVASKNKELNMSTGGDKGEHGVGIE